MKKEPSHPNQELLCRKQILEAGGFHVFYEAELRELQRHRGGPGGQETLDQKPISIWATELVLPVQTVLPGLVLLAKRQVLTKPSWSGSPQ